MILDKEQALERTINASIRMTLMLDDPVPLHVLLLSAYDALREYAKAKAIFIEFELADYIKEEFQKEWVNEYFKKKFYFLKHGTPGTDFVDFNNITFINDMQLLHNMYVYRTIFQRCSAHMQQFSFILAGIYPNLFHWHEMKLPADFAYDLTKISADLTRKEMLSGCCETFNDNPEVLKELERDRALALAEDPARRHRLKKGRI